MSSSLADGSKHVSELQRNLKIVKDIHYFEGFPPEVVKLIAYLFEQGRYQAGDVLVERGDDPGIAFYILQGSVGVYYEVEGQEKLLRSYGEKEFLGAFSLVGSMPSLFTLKVEAPSLLLILTRDQFLAIREKYPKLAPLLRKAMLKQLRMWEQRNLEELDLCCLQKVGVTLL